MINELDKTNSSVDSFKTVTKHWEMNQSPPDRAISCFPLQNE